MTVASRSEPFHSDFRYVIVCSPRFELMSCTRIIIYYFDLHYLSPPGSGTKVQGSGVVLFQLRSGTYGEPGHRAPGGGGRFAQRGASRAQSLRRTALDWDFS